MADPDAQISRTAGLTYWNSIPSTVNGMLGGYPQISRVDMRGSLTFISKLRPSSSNSSSKPTSSLLPRAVDIGAGIGRITAGVLSRVAAVVDVVEPVAKFAEQARTLGQDGNETAMGQGRIGHVHVCGVEDWVPEETYDLIWFQWCLGHLTAEHTVTTLRRCIDALSQDGWIVVKENMSTHVDGEDMYDDVDSSVTRTDDSYRAMFEKAGLRVERSEVQKGFPAELYPVRMYALRPDRK